MWHLHGRKCLPSASLNEQGRLVLDASDLQNSHLPCIKRCISRLYNEVNGYSFLGTVHLLIAYTQAHGYESSGLPGRTSIARSSAFLSTLNRIFYLKWEDHGFLLALLPPLNPCSPHSTHALHTHEHRNKSRISSHWVAEICGEECTSKPTSTDTSETTDTSSGTRRETRSCALGVSGTPSRQIASSSTPFTEL